MSLVLGGVLSELALYRYQMVREGLYKLDVVSMIEACLPWLTYHAGPQEEDTPQPHA